MDLRIQKTKRQIAEAFLTLRATLPPEKIKVKDICEIAMINKTTFYKHYDDSIELAEDIDTTAVNKIIEGFESKYSFIDSPQGYVEGLCAAILKYAEKLRLIYRGREEKLCMKLGKELSKCYGEHDSSEEGGMLFSMILGGLMSILTKALFSDDFKDKLKAICTVQIERIVAMFKPICDKEG